MGTEKPDDNNGNGKSNLESNDPINDNKGKGKSPILESSDPINPIGTTAESNDKEKPPASTPSGTSDLQSDANVSGSSTLLANDGSSAFFGHTTLNLQSDAYSGQSSASGSETSTFLAHSSINDKEKPPASSTPPGTSNLQSDAYAYAGPSSAQPAMSGSSLPQGFQGNQAQQPPIIAAALKVRFPQIKFSQVYIGDTLFVAQYELVRVSTKQRPSIGNMPSLMANFQGPSHVQSGNILPSAAADNITGPSHGSVPVQTGDILPGTAADDNITGQGSIPQASNILGKRECESSPPVGSMPSQGLTLNRYTESSSSYDTDSQTPSSTEESSQEALKKICMLCKRDVNEQPISSISVLACGHVFHDECLKKITCIICDTVEP